MSKPDRALLHGWGRTAPTLAEHHLVDDVATVTAGLRHAPPRGVVARGLGRSYNDAAQNAGGRVLAMSGLDAVHRFDHVRGTITAGAGLSLHTLLIRALPHGWFLPVTPGTRQVTLGGAFAGDVHGKNHHRDGSFAQHVASLVLVTPDGTSRTLTATDQPEHFWATAGGMGLTGVITELTLQLLPVETAWMRVHTDRVDDLDAMLSLLAAGDHDAPYSVAWLDALRTGRTLGRGVVTRGWHATRDELPATGAREPLAFTATTRVSAPAVFPPGLLNRASVRAFNELWFRKAPRRQRDALQPLAAFFHPLDGVGNWNRIYGPRGLLQYQFVVPDCATDVLTDALERIGRAGTASFLAVLKRFGPGNPGPLSFPRAGWTLALDLPNVAPAAGLLDELDRLVVAAEGRVNLTKDARLPAELLPLMYPRLDVFRAVRHELDPHGQLRSDLARRLGL